MEWNERLAAARKSAGLTQEQLGELVGVTRQAVSKWESAQTVPDAVTIAQVCQALRVSADYVLLGREPEDGAPESAAPAPPEICPCCKRPVRGSLCATCGYVLPYAASRGPRYALVGSPLFSFETATQSENLVKYCGMTEDQANAAVSRMLEPEGKTRRYLLARDLTDSAAHWIVNHIREEYALLHIVECQGDEDEDALLFKPPAMDLPPMPRQSDGIGFWGVVGAVIVALLILSFL